MIRMLALDLDETTLRSDGTISLYTMQTLQRAAAQGVILVAASGRPLRSLPEHLQACGVRYAVVSNGAAVYELEGEQLLRQLFLPADAVTALFQLVQEEQDRQVLVEAGLHGQMYAPADYVADPISFRYNAAVAAYVRRTRKPVEDMARFLQMHVQEIDCMDIICPNGTRKAQMAQKVSNAGLPVYMTSSVRAAGGNCPCRCRKGKRHSLFGETVRYLIRAGDGVRKCGQRCGNAAGCRHGRSGRQCHGELSGSGRRYHRFQR